MYLYGAGGHAKVILEILAAAQTPAQGIWDEHKEGGLLGCKIAGKFDPENLPHGHEMILAIGSNQVRKKLSGQHAGIKFASAIHPTACISPTAKIGTGTVVMANVTVNADTVVGEHCILNTNCSVDHDNQIGNFAHISPNAALAGNVVVGEGTHIGIGACVIQGIKIGKWATIGAGTVVITDVPDYAVVVGNPGKIIKYNTI
ncbi:acetyltransferase [Mucilaginibacter terrigena]|uniref:Acetyltransferase n=1 Tax=Mucilaginibacter terrigena TaxID=2492395 RepID=A0A4Q5LLF0_9SPHI|nr:acetyltransferase [Mucilaginibacter terrigena]